DAAEFGPGTEAVAGDSVWRLDCRAVELHTPARLDRPRPLVRGLRVTLRGRCRPCGGWSSRGLGLPRGVARFQLGHLFREPRDFCLHGRELAFDGLDIGRLGVSRDRRERTAGKKEGKKRSHVRTSVADGRGPAMTAVLRVCDNDGSDRAVLPSACQRQAYGYRRAFALAAGYFEPAAMALDDMLDDRESQSSTAGGAAAAWIDAIESTGQVRDMLRIDALAL